jgi:hypothetical protein
MLIELLKLMHGIILQLIKSWKITCVLYMISNFQQTHTHTHIAAGPKVKVEVDIVN